MERPGEVDRNNAVPRVEGDVSERLEPGDARARDHDLDRPELAADLVQRFVDGVAVGDVDRARNCLSAVVPQVVGRPLRSIAVDVEHADAVPAVAEVMADREPHPGGATRHDCDPAHALPLTCTPPRLGSRVSIYHHP